MHVVMQSAIALGVSVAFGVGGALLAPACRFVAFRWNLFRSCGAGRLRAVRWMVR